MTPAEVVELVFPEHYPEHGEHSMVCACRATHATCKMTTPTASAGAVAGYAAHQHEQELRAAVGLPPC